MGIDGTGDRVIITKGGREFEIPKDNITLLNAEKEIKLLTSELENVGHQCLVYIKAKPPELRFTVLVAESGVKIPKNWWLGLGGVRE